MFFYFGKNACSDFAYLCLMVNYVKFCLATVGALHFSVRRLRLRTFFILRRNGYAKRYRIMENELN